MKNANYLKKVNKFKKHNIAKFSSKSKCFFEKYFSKTMDFFFLTPECQWGNVQKKCVNSSKVDVKSMTTLL